MTSSALRFSLVLLAGACATFATVLGLQLASDKPNVEDALMVAPKTVREEAESAPARFAMPPLSSFAEIGERPLFSRSRRPPLIPESTGESAGALVLNGILMTGADRIALLADPAAERMTPLREGDILAGWTLVAIHPEKVVIRNNGMEQELQIADTLKRAESPVRQRAQKLRTEQMRAELARQQALRAQQQRVAARNAAEPTADGSPAESVPSPDSSPESQQKQEQEGETPEPEPEPEPPAGIRP
jgi:hypothetical protein